MYSRSFVAKLLWMTRKRLKSFVTQSEAKSLGGIHVDVLEILRRDAPLDDKKKAPLDDNKKENTNKK